MQPKLTCPTCGKDKTKRAFTDFTRYPAETYDECNECRSKPRKLPPDATNEQISEHSRRYYARMARRGFR